MLLTYGFRVPPFAEPYGTPLACLLPEPWPPRVKTRGGFFMRVAGGGVADHAVADAGDLCGDGREDCPRRASHHAGPRHSSQRDGRALLPLGAQLRYASPARGLVFFRVQQFLNF